jgi:thiosulfate reductase cytochrome b subunit
MELMSTAQDEERDHSVMEALRVRAWRAEQLRHLGLPHTLAYAFADLVDWHTLAALIERGCPPQLALEIVR